MNRPQIHPLSYGQQALWFIYQEAPESAAYNMTLPLRLEGNRPTDGMEPEIVKEAVQMLVERHLALRSTFGEQDGIPYQCFDADDRPTNMSGYWQEVDATGWTESELMGQIQQISRQPFVLERRGVFRATLFLGEAIGVVLLLNLHHIAGDAGSLSILGQELLQNYADLAGGIARRCPAVAASYSDYVAWEVELLSSRKGQRMAAYWQKQLAGDVPVLQLPTDFPRPPAQTFNGASVTFELSPELTQRLKHLAKTHRSTLFTILLSAYQVLLHRYSGQSDIWVGVPTSIPRNEPAFSDMVGYLVNPMIVKAQFTHENDGSFSQLMQQTGEQVLKGLYYQPYPFSWLIQQLLPQRDLSYPPLIQVMFALEQHRLIPKSFSVDNYSAKRHSVSQTEGQFDMSLTFSDDSDGKLLSGILSYNCDLFESATIERLASHLQVLLEGVVDDVEQSVHRLPLLTNLEQADLVKWNNTNTESTVGGTMVELFEQQVQKTPNNIAVFFGDCSLTYYQLNEKANQLAHYLLTKIPSESSPTENRIIAIVVERSLEMIIGLLGTLKAGGVYVPIDPNYPTARIQYMLEYSTASLLLTQSHLTPKLPVLEKVMVVCLDSAARDEQPTENPPIKSQINDLAYVIFTSGSTGNPKGVMIDHRGAVNTLLDINQRFGVVPQDRMLALSALNFDLSVYDIFGILACGAALVIPNASLDRDPAHWVALMQKHEVTLWNTVPALMQMLVDFIEEQPERVPPALRLCLMSGDWIPLNLLSRIKNLWSHAQVISLGGATEASIWSIYYPIEEVDPTWQSIPYGKPLSNQSFYVLTEHLEPCPIGVPGEMYIGGIGVAQGYWRDEEKTRNSFIRHRGTKERLYKTGDKGRFLPNRNIEFLGRVDFQVKIRGYRIELGEIEATIEKSPKVQEAAVIVQGEAEHKQLLAYFVPQLDSQAQSRLATLEQESKRNQVKRWQQLFSETYAEPVSHEMGRTLNTAGWNSSYTGLPIPQREMQEWCDGTVEQILAKSPQRVLEIGCGTGMLLFRIAPHCDRYIGTDLSQPALDFIEQQKANEPFASKVTLFQSAADRITGIEPASVDMVILNSVIQYFPSIDYLLTVLTSAIKTVVPGGHLFIGDVRNLQLLEAFHASVQYQQADGSLSLAQLQQRVGQSINQEKELLIDPDFFLALKQHFSQITQVQIQLKPGYAHNEMTCFRYDVTLHIGGEMAPLNPFQWLDWEKDHLRLDKVHQRLLEEQPDFLGLTNIPNARLSVEAEILERWTPSGETVENLRNGINSFEQGVEPEALRTLIEQLPYTSYVGYHGKYHFFVVFQRQVADTSSHFAEVRSVSEKPWQVYANNPLPETIADQSVVRELRDFVGQTLPDYMMPVAFIPLDFMPLTPNGKLDRGALLKNALATQVAEITAGPKPATPTETLLASLWKTLLTRETINRHDNFFELGGHSLLATQLVAHIRAQRSVELSVRTIFEHPQLADLAATIDEAFRAVCLPPIECQAEKESRCLSFAQQRLWFLSQFEAGGNSNTYNIPLTLQLSGHVDVTAIQHSLRWLVERHDSLRTCFPIEAEGTGQPQIRVLDEMEALSIHDLRHIPAAEQSTEVKNRAKRHAIAPFNLAEGPLFKAELILLGDEQSALLLNMHHIVSDGWSVAVFIQDLQHAYNAFVQGEQPTLPSLGIKYSDYAAWQRAWLQGEVLQKQLDYWQQQLADIPELLELPTDQPRPAQQSYRGAHYFHHVPSRLSQQLTRLSQQQGASVFMVLLSAFYILLSRYSRFNDICVGSPIANRVHRQTEELIGFFVNTLVLRGKVRPEQSFIDLLQETRQTCLAAYAHQDIPFEMLVEQLQPTRSLSHSPLFQVMLAQNNQPTQLTLHDLAVDISIPDYPISKFDLTLYVEEKGEQSHFMWEYATDLFYASTIERMASHFERLLTAVVSDPEQPISQLMMLTETDIRQLQAWNNTTGQGTVGGTLTIVDLFEQQAAKTPDNIAVVFEEKGGRPKQITYQQLNEQSNQVAHHLLMLRQQKQITIGGKAPHWLVAIALDRSLEMVIGLLGILKAGAAYMPIDLDYPVARIQYMLEDSAAPILLTWRGLLQSELKERLELDWGNQGRVVVYIDDIELPAPPLVNPEEKPWDSHPKATDLAYVIYTSGSTGKPKGVMIEHHSLSNLLLDMQQRIGITSRDKLLAVTTLSFDIAALELYLPLITGSLLCLASRMTANDGLALQQQIAKHQIGFMQATPATWQLLKHSGWQMETPLTLLCGGEALPAELANYLLANHHRLWNVYGPTETTIWSSAYRIQRDLTAFPPIGNPIANTRIYILNAQHQLQPPGIPGELCIAGDGLARGYLNRPDLTAEKFIQVELLGKVESIYRTGDLARWVLDTKARFTENSQSLRDPGYLEYLGRLDHQIKLRGFRIELGEIESVLDQHQTVKEAVVILYDEEHGTIAHKRLVAYITVVDSHPTEGALSAELKHWLKTRLPDYMIPTQFVVLDKLPLTPNGKIDRKTLPALEIEPAADRSPLATPTEELLASLWADVLKCEVTSRNDHFFELGGHSLLATQLIARVRDSFQTEEGTSCHSLELPVQAVFEYPQLKSLATVIESATNTVRVPPIERQSINASKVLSFAQQRLWFLNQFETGGRPTAGSPTGGRPTAGSPTGGRPTASSPTGGHSTDKSITYNMPIALQLSGHLDVETLQRSFQWLIERHESLRTCFPVEDGQAQVQILNTIEGISIHSQSFPAAEQASEVQIHANRHAIDPFDLEHGPLFKADLLLLDEQQSVLLLNMHHIISDGWSIGVLLRDWQHAYSAFAQGEQPNLPLLEIQYSDYSAWQRNWLQGDVLQQQLDYWKHQLVGIPELLELPTDKPRSAQQSYQGAHYTYPLSSTLSENLKQLSRDLGASLFMTSLSAFYILLARYSRQEDICVGSPIANRTHRQTEDMIGFFVNTLVLRGQLQPDQSFTDLLRETRQTCLAGYAHQDIPFEMLVEQLQPTRSLSHSPLFQVMLSMQTNELTELALPNLEVKPFAPDFPVAKFDLTLNLEERNGQLHCMWEYATDLFVASTIERMARHFEVLLTAIVENPAQQISHLPLLTEREILQLKAWNGTTILEAEGLAPYNAPAASGDFVDKTIVDLFEQQVEKTPDNIAVAFEEDQGGRAALSGAALSGAALSGAANSQLTYQQLNEKANQLAHHLLVLLNQAGSKMPRHSVDGRPATPLIAIAVERSLDMVIGILGILKAGGAYVPIDTSYPAARILHILEDSAAPLLLTQSHIKENLPLSELAHSCQVVCLDTDRPATSPLGNLEIRRQRDQSQWPERGRSDEPSLLLSEDLAYVIYTSGSTGGPKGCLMTHANVTRLLATTEAWFQFSQTDVWTLFHSYAFDFSVWEMWGALLYGGKLVVVPYFTSRAPEAFYQLLIDHKVTVLNQTPSAFGQLSQVDERPDQLSLRLIIFGGEMLEFARLQPWFARHGDTHPQLINMYGITETTVHVTYYPLTQQNNLGHSIIGIPLPDLQVWLVDEHHQPVPIGVPGEMVISGAGVTQGYLNRPELTKEKFIEIELFGETRRIYKSGDLARWVPAADGCHTDSDGVARRSADGTLGHLEYLGRIDHQVKLRGFRIELGEIEAVLNQHEMAKESIVVHAKKEDNSYLMAYVMLDKSDGLAWSDDTADSLRAWLKTHLPDYMVPAYFQALDALPLTPNGKVDRAALRRKALEKQVTMDGVKPSRGMTPRTAEEELLANLWAAVLGVEQVSIDDNFFELGGHSLLATQVVSRIRDAFDIELSLRDFFNAPTIALLRTKLAEAQQQSRPPLVAGPHAEQRPLSFAQERLWFLDQLTPDNPFYNSPLALRLHGTLNKEALQRSLNELVTRHETLRTVFKNQEGKAYAHILLMSATEVSIEQIDLSAKGASEQELSSLISEKAHIPFDLTREMPLRATLFKLQDEDYVLLLTIHHIATDGWSMGVLTHELGMLYNAFVQGKPSPLAALSIQYVDFTFWQRNWFTGEVVEQQQQFWLDKLADMPTVLELPTDHPRPPVHSYRGAEITYQLSTELTTQLKRFSQKHGTTLFMTTLAAFSVVINRYTGQDRFVVGSPIANRHHQALESLIGFFVNTLALPIDLTEQPSFFTLLRQIRQTTLEAYTHQDLPFERLVDNLNLDRDMSRNPLVQVMFALQNAPMEPMTLTDLNLSIVSYGAQSVRCDLEVHLWEHSNALTCVVYYYQDLFEAATVERLLRHFENMLLAIVVDAERPVHQYPLLTDGEIQHLQAWNQTEMDYPKNQTIISLFEQQVKQTPNQTAVVFEEKPNGVLQLSYQQLNERANQLAHLLQTMGVPPQTFVGVCLKRSPNMIVALLGILKVGAAYLPIDPDYPDSRITFMLDDAEVSVVLTSSDLVEKFPETVKPLCLDTEVFEQSKTNLSQSRLTAEALAYVCYTSGSTGTPKGVCVCHQSVVRLVKNTDYIQLNTDDHMAQASNIAFDAATFEIWGALLNGATLVIVPKEIVLSPSEFASYLRATSINTLFLTTALFNQMARHAASGFASLKNLLFGGEAVDPKSVALVLEQGAPQRLLHVYGPTENTTFSTWYLVNTVSQGATTVPIGQPLSNDRVYILDRYHHPLPIGVPGELCIAGDGLAQGYLNRSELTTEKFVDVELFGKQERIYKTGDLARWRSNGVIEYLSRLDRQVKLRGFRIELGEIEATLTGYPWVKDAALILSESAHTHEKRLVGYVVPQLDIHPTEFEAVLQESSDTFIAKWKELYDDIVYKEAQSELTFNLSGWQSSYTGEAIPASEMKVWTDSIVAAIRALNPQTVLEIGCGTGLLLSRIAPHCQTYWGTDFSPVVLQQVEQLKQAQPELAHVRLEPRMADDFSDIQPAQFDTIVLNSVVQYFPSVDYLIKVLEQAIDVIKPGGHLFVGDIRHLPLLRTYHASVQAYQASEDLPQSVLRQRVSQQQLFDKELVIDPRLFLVLYQRHPRVTGVKIRPHRGLVHNELTRFRYQVVLEIEHPPPSSVTTGDWLDWPQELFSLAQLREQLEKQPAVMGLHGVPNARLESEIAIVEWLDNAPTTETVGELRQHLATQTFEGVDPEILWQLGDQLGYEVDIRCHAVETPDHYEVLFKRCGDEVAQRADFPIPHVNTANGFNTWQNYANTPLHGQLGEKLAPQLRAYLKERLPEYMIPSVFVLLDTLPLTPNGKIDRKALPDPESAAQPGISQYIAPQTQTEKMLALIWADVLGLERVGIHDNFFELGGHSLLATQIISRLRQSFEPPLEIAVRALFEAPTVAELAESIGLATDWEPIKNETDDNWEEFEI